jgi:putative MATE family efflux protein
MMGTPASVLPLSSLYMKIYFAGAIFTLVYNFCAAILRAAGDTKSPLIFLFLSGIINVVLNWLFVKHFHMNVEGVALATVISQAISAILVTVALMRRTDACRLQLGKIRFYKDQLLKIIRIGLPAGIQSSLFAISNVTIQSSINSFGNTLMSGNGAASSIEGFLYVSVNAFQQTAINFIGQNVGAGQYKRAKKALYICLSCAVVVALILGGLVTIFGEELLSIYINDSPAAIHRGIVRFQYVALFYFICALMDVTTGALRGMGASLVPMLISVLGVCGIRLGWIYTIFRHPIYHTPECLYTSYPLSWFITFLFQLLAFFLVYRKRTRSNTLAHP